MSQPLLSQAQQWIENNPQLLTPLLPITGTTTATTTTTTTSLNQTPLHLIYSIFHNILIDPKNEKFRHLKMENKKLKEFILEIDGAIDLLYLFGFEMIGGNDLFLDFNQINLNEIKSFVNYLEKQYFTINNNNQPINQPINTTPTNQKQSSFIQQQPLQQTQSTNYNNTTNNTTTNVIKTKEELEKERILEERKRQLAEEKRLKREEMNRIKKQSKLDRKEKQKDDEEEQLHPHQEHHSSSYGTDKRHSGTNYSGMTTYKDLGVNM